MSLALVSAPSASDHQTAALLARLRAVEHTLARAADVLARGRQRTVARSADALALQAQWAAAQRTYRDAFWAVHHELVRLGSRVYALPPHPRTQLVQEFFERLNTTLEEIEFPGSEAWSH